jgi:hypothetical protein
MGDRPWGAAFFDDVAHVVLMQNKSRRAATAARLMTLG